MNERDRLSDTPWAEKTILYQRETDNAEERQPLGDTNEGREETKLTFVMSQQSNKIRIIVYNATSAESWNNDISKWLTKLKPGLSTVELTKDKSSLISNASPIDIYTLNLDEVSEQENRKTTIVENLERSWCKFVSSKLCRHLWLETKHISTSAEARLSPKDEVEVVSMSLGSFPTTGRYFHHWNSGAPRPELKISICFDYDLEIGTIIYDIDSPDTTVRRDTWKLETAFDHLYKFLLVTHEQTEFHVYLFQRNPFKILQDTTSRPFTGPPKSDMIDKEELAETEFYCERDVHFGNCPTDVIGSSNVMHLKFGKNDSKLNHVLSRLAKLGFSIMTGYPLVENASPRVAMPWPKFESFPLTYAWYCLLSRGFKVTDQLTNSFVDLVHKIQHEPWLEATLKSVTAAFDNSSFCNLENQFHEGSEKIRRQILAGDLVGEKDGLMGPGVVAVRRLILTPTTINGMGEEWTVENRVLREFGAERFIRVSFRDEDFSKLTGYIFIKKISDREFGADRFTRVSLRGEDFSKLTVYSSIQNISDRVISFLENGSKIGNEHYRFLGCSNSQMRSHSVWMYASDGKHTVESIRKWMGDISDERCVATYVSRLGQCFTTTRDTVEVKNVELIEDIQRDTEYCFTDGIGRISKTLANRVKEALHLGYAPSAFQIRFGGCKGVVALAPDIGEEEKLQIRKSMEKFPSSHNHIEVVETTRPVRLCLNRQAMLLLSGLGVPDDSFFKLQDRMLENMAKILIDEGTAVKEIAKAHLGIELKELQDSGFAVTLEPFLREVLATIYRQRFNDLLKRTHIEIPDDKGRMMMGTVDEFDCLEYGEVFVKFSKDIDRPMLKKVVLGGSVVVTKSPCFHPGDMRKFTAVDRAQLHHMVDCIVFPAKGQRPHPNEMSGSDLDGDLYFVCWEESLIPPGENKQPMDFTPKEKQALSKEVTESDMIRFIGDYISSDQLGVIANAHLVHADSNDIHCGQCIEIAQKHSDAVDFIKTGQRQTLPKRLRPASYPDYMMKNDKPSYISDTVIGKLFHQCRVIGLSNEYRKLEPILPDPDLILPGHEKYLDEVKKMKAIYDIQINELKTMYGIESEVELLSVGALGMKERLGHLKGDHYAATEIIRMRIHTIKEKMEKLFYEEFGKSNRKHDNAVLRQKASALYKVSYSSTEQDLDKCDRNSSIQTETVATGYVGKAKNTEDDVETSRSERFRQSLGLPWIFSSLLCMIKKETTTESRFALRELNATEIRPTSFLHKLSLDIDKDATNAEYWKKKQASGHEPLLIERLKLWNSRYSSNNENGVQLIWFGSAITSFAGDSPSLDIFIRNDPLEPSWNNSDETFEQLAKIVEDFAQFVEGNLLHFEKSKATNKVRVVDIPGTSPVINLHSDEQCLRRTAYIVAAVMLNKWTVPVLRVVLQWGRNCRIADGSYDSLLTEEELTIMFYHAVINGVKYGNPIRDEDLSRSNLLIMNNHFQTCNLFTCTHFQTESLTEDRSSSTDGFREFGEVTGVSDRVCSMENAISGCGRALVGFFLFYGTYRGSRLKDVPDPHLISDPHLQPNDEQCLLNLKDEQYVLMGDQMLEAYHSLANCASIDDFFSLKCLEDRHFSMVLPNEVSSLYQSFEADLEKSLKQESCVIAVNVRKKKFRGFPSGLVVEAWGSAKAIKSLSAIILSIISSAACFTLGKIARDRWCISDANRTTFEGIYGPADNLGMFRYDGRCQTWHAKLLQKIPLVTRLYDATDDYNMKKMSCFFEEQRDFIRKNYKKMHGRIRVTISFGNLYTVGYPLRPITAGELSKKLSGRPMFKKAAHVKQNIHTHSDFRHQDPERSVKQTSEKCTVGHSSVPSPEITNISGGSSLYRLDSDSTCGHDVLSSANTSSCENATKQISSNVSSDSKEYLAEDTRLDNSYLGLSRAVGHSISCQNPAINDSSVGLVNSQTPQKCHDIQEIGHGAVSDQESKQISTPENVSTILKHHSRKEDSAFLPINDLNLARLTEFLEQHDFVETEHLREYRATVNNVTEITLDENSALKAYRLQDIKWYVLNVVRGRTSKQFRENQRKDIRIQMRSRPFFTAEELVARPGYKDLRKDAPELLSRNSEGKVNGIAKHNYKDIIEYIRYKDRTSYQYQGGEKTGKRDNVFLNRFTLILNNKGNEYRKRKDGSYEETEHTEVVLETEPPNLEDKEECEEFMRKIYEFSKYFARRVID